MPSFLEQNGHCGLADYVREFDEDGELKINPEINNIRNLQHMFKAQEIKKEECNCKRQFEL